MRVEAKVGTGVFAFLLDLFALIAAEGERPSLIALARFRAKVLSRGGMETVDDSARRAGMVYEQVQGE
jgi:hypothetical protein